MKNQIVTKLLGPYRTWARTKGKVYFKCHKVHFRENSALLPTKSALLHKECFIAIKHSFGAIKHFLWAIKYSCLHALVQTNSLWGSCQYDKTPEPVEADSHAALSGQLPQPI